jgi:predicted N-acetyltransferase YhbS
MELVPATGAVLQQILDTSHPLWGEGLSRSAYEQYNLAQLRTTWAAARLDRVALADGARVLSSAKRYQLDAVVDGRPIRLLGIGAVFTPPAHRGQGFARLLIERLLERAAADGFAAALLFSEIGSDYYARMGFEIVPRDTVQVQVDRKPGAPGVVVRAGDARDLPALAEISAGLAARHRLALHRTPAWIEYGLTKKRLLAGFSVPGARAVQFLVVEEGGGAVAYVVVVQTPRGWALEEFGDRDPSGPRVGALLQVLLAREPDLPHPVLRAWLPAGWLPPQLSIVSRAAADEVMMIRPLAADGDVLRLLPPQDVLYFHGDVF